MSVNMVIIVWNCQSWSSGHKSFIYQPHSKNSHPLQRFPMPKQHLFMELVSSSSPTYCYLHLVQIQMYSLSVVPRIDVSECISSRYEELLTKETRFCPYTTNRWCKKKHRISFIQKRGKQDVRSSHWSVDILKYLWAQVANPVIRAQPYSVAFGSKFLLLVLSSGSPFFFHQKLPVFPVM